MIIGVGIDVVPVERFAAALERTTGLAARLFTAAEQVTTTGRARSPESLAARFAAKEALAKALGAPGNMRWHDAVVRVDGAGQPHLDLSGTVAARAAVLGVGRVHVSLSHDGGIASAFVLAESADAFPAAEAAGGTADAFPAAEAAGGTADAFPAAEAAGAGTES